MIYSLATMEDGRTSESQYPSLMSVETRVQFGPPTAFPQLVFARKGSEAIHTVKRFDVGTLEEARTK